MFTNKLSHAVLLIFLGAQLAYGMDNYNTNAVSGADYHIEDIEANIARLNDRLNNRLCQPLQVGHEEPLLAEHRDTPGEISVTRAGRDEANGLYQLYDSYQGFPRYRQEQTSRGACATRRPMFIWYFASREAWYMGHWGGSQFGSTYQCPATRSQALQGPPKAGWRLGWHGRAFCGCGWCKRSGNNGQECECVPTLRFDTDGEETFQQGQRGTKVSVVCKRKAGALQRCTNGYNPVPMRTDHGIHFCGGTAGYRFFKAGLDPLMLRSLFRGLQGWNQGYRNAQRIFGSGCQAAIARQMIRVQNNWAFGGPALHSVTFAPRSCRTMNSGDDFLKLIDYGRLANDEKTFFTYVLHQDGSLRFAHTGSITLRDYSSKHAVLSNCSEEVYYAGEFHVERNNNGEYTLVVDNNSGTYAPDGDKLDAMRKALELAFPGLRVRTLKAGSQELTAAIDACPSRR